MAIFSSLHLDVHVSSNENLKKKPDSALHYNDTKLEGDVYMIK